MQCPYRRFPRPSSNTLRGAKSGQYTYGAYRGEWENGRNLHWWALWFPAGNSFRGYRGCPLRREDRVLRIQLRSASNAPMKRPASRPQGSSPPHRRTTARYLGKWAYLAAWDVHASKLFGRCKPKTGITLHLCLTGGSSHATDSLPGRLTGLSDCR